MILRRHRDGSVEILSPGPRVTVSRRSLDYYKSMGWCREEGDRIVFSDLHGSRFRILSRPGCRCLGCGMPLLAGNEVARDHVAECAPALLPAGYEIIDYYDLEKEE